MAFCYSPQVVDGSYNISVKLGSFSARLVLATLYGKIRNKQNPFSLWVMMMQFSMILSNCGDLLVFKYH